jgi:hypothetical protein
MSVEILRLRSGEDILCDVITEIEGKYVVENPAVVMPVGRNDDGAMQMALSPWMPYSTNTEFIIPEDFVVTSAKPTEDILASYSTMYSKIYAPKSQILS